MQSLRSGSLWNYEFWKRVQKTYTGAAQETIVNRVPFFFPYQKKIHHEEIIFWLIFVNLLISLSASVGIICVCSVSGIKTLISSSKENTVVQDAL